VLEQELRVSGRRHKEQAAYRVSSARALRGKEQRRRDAQDDELRLLQDQGALLSLGGGDYHLAAAATEDAESSTALTGGDEAEDDFGRDKGYFRMRAADQRRDQRRRRRERAWRRHRTLRGEAVDEDEDEDGAWAAGRRAGLGSAGRARRGGGSAPQVIRCPEEILSDSDDSERDEEAQAVRFSKLTQ
ncbi:MAG: hypothetical protein AAFU61_17915, partial [Pseudomonadota bacterium]